MGLLAIEGGEQTAVSSPSIAAMTMEPAPGVRERSTIRVSPARIPCSAMSPPSTVTKNVAAGRFMNPDMNPDSTPERPVFNRTVALRDTWARLQAKRGGKVGQGAQG